MFVDVKSFWTEGYAGQISNSGHEQSAYIMIFFVSSISYRPTDLSLLESFSKNVSFSNSYKLPSQSAVQKISLSMVIVMIMFGNFEQ